MPAVGFGKLELGANAPRAFGFEKHERENYGVFGPTPASLGSKRGSNSRPPRREEEAFLGPLPLGLSGRESAWGREREVMGPGSLADIR